MTVDGPIRQDRLWFFGALRPWGTRNPSIGLFLNANQGGQYVPDLNKPAFRDERYQSHAIRLTRQASKRNRLNFFTDLKADCICASGGAASGLRSGSRVAAEAESNWDLWPNGLIQATWTSRRTGKPDPHSPALTVCDVLVTRTVGPFTRRREYAAPGFAAGAHDRLENLAAIEQPVGA